MKPLPFPVSRSRWRLSESFLLVAFIGVILLMLFDDWLAEHLHKEVFKVLADFVVTAGIGGAATFLYHDIKSANERREADRRVRCETLAEILAAYNEIKEVRRLLRAEAIRPEYQAEGARVLPVPYASLMRRFNQAQLKIETQIRLIENSAERYHEPEYLARLLGKIETYLGQVVGEWETRLAKIEESPEGVTLGSLPRLHALVDKAENGFRSGVGQPLGTVFSLLGERVR